MKVIINPFESKHSEAYPVNRKSHRIIYINIISIKKAARSTKQSNFVVVGDIRLSTATVEVFCREIHPDEKGLNHSKQLSPFLCSSLKQLCGRTTRVYIHVVQTRTIFFAVCSVYNGQLYSNKQNQIANHTNDSVYDIDGKFSARARVCVNSVSLYYRSVAWKSKRSFVVIGTFLVCT